MLKLDPGILGSEPPVSSSFSLVALSLQGSNLIFQRSFIADAPVQALPTEHAELNLRHPFDFVYEKAAFVKSSSGRRPFLLDFPGGEVKAASPPGVSGPAGEP